MSKLRILSAVIAAAVSANSFAADQIQPLSADQFTVGGEVAVGGYYDTETKYMNDGVTGIELGVSYKNAGIVGYYELDIDANYGKGDSVNDIVTNTDKAWIGYDFGAGVLSVGTENDTALDEVDGAGDLTVEFGMSAAEADDAFDVVKFQGSTGGLAYGISYFEGVDDSTDGHVENITTIDDRGYNGYVGFEGDKFNVYAGYEERKSDYQVVTVTGNVDLGVVKLGANWWKQENKNSVNGKDNEGIYLSAAKSFGQLTISGGYAKTNDVETINPDIDSFTDLNDGAFNIGAWYDMSKNTFVALDIAHNNTRDEQTAYFIAGYTF